MSEEQISVERQQCRVLVEAIKKIVTCPRTPSWIKNPLESAVKEAKALRRDVQSVPGSNPSAEAEVVSEPAKNEIVEEIDLDVGVECSDALDPRDECRYEIVSRGLEIERVQLYDVRVTRGDDKTPVGVTIHNVPATHLRGIRRLPETSSR